MQVAGTSSVATCRLLLVKEAWQKSASASQLFPTSTGWFIALTMTTSGSIQPTNNANLLADYEDH